MYYSYGTFTVIFNLQCKSLNHNLQCVWFLGERQNRVGTGGRSGREAEDVPVLYFNEKAGGFTTEVRGRQAF